MLIVKKSKKLNKFNIIYCNKILFCFNLDELSDVNFISNMFFVYFCLCIILENYGLIENNVINYLEY